MNKKIEHPNDDDFAFEKSSVLMHMTRYKSALDITFKNCKSYCYKCKSDRQAKIWFNRIKKAESAGAEYTKFKALGLDWS